MPALTRLAATGILMSTAFTAAGGEPLSFPFEMTEAQRARLHQALEPLHAQYDPKEQMLLQKFGSPGYHTTLKGGTVHPTRNALNYAVACLDAGDEELRKRAEAILLKMVSLQDQDPKSKTYGIWSWFLEEPLDKMSPPDWNWADFCGVQLLQVVLYHRARLPEDLRKKVDEALQHAARSIQRRNVGSGYTNIAVMGAYVTLTTAETYGLADLREYALARLKRFHEYTLSQGAFTEYNSPTYTVVALEELGRMRAHFRDPEARRLAEELYRFAWRELARHFHAPTRQWAGPHSRAYSSLCGENVWRLIDEGTQGRTQFVPQAKARLDEARLPLPCPEDLRTAFTEPKLPRTEEEVFVKRDGANPAVVGTTFLDHAFALGSVNRGDLWNQRRPLLAHWGEPGGKGAYLQVRFLHDGYDFSAMQFFAVQREGRVLAGIVLATDGGDRHISLDRIKNATIRAKDLRLRFEFGVSGTGWPSILSPEAPASPDAPARLTHGGVHIALGVPYARWGEEAGRWETGREKDRAFLDRILFQSAEPKEIRLDQLPAAAAGIWVSISAQPLDAEPPAQARERDGRLELDWQGLHLSLPVRPGTAKELQQAFTARKDGE
jgi:hypothetical protein